MIEYADVVSITQIPVLDSYSRCIQPRRIVLDGSNAFDRVPHLHELLVRVEHVVFRYRVTSQIPQEWWPPKTTRVEHMHNASTSWPDTITTLHIALHYSPDEEELDEFPSLPSALQVLYVNGTLYQPIKRGALPASLLRLTIEDLMCSLEDEALPDSLTHLTIEYMETHEYIRWRMPSSLLYLKLSLGVTTPVDAFNVFVATLPDSLEILHIVDPIPLMRVNKWPASLRELHMDPLIIKLLIVIDGGEMGLRVQNKLHFESFPSTFESLHLMFKRLQIAHDPRTNYHYVYMNESKLYTFAPGEDRITLGDEHVDRDGQLIVLHRKLQ
jgi:hypothetical protein